MRSARWQIFSPSRNTARIGFCRALNALTPDDITIKEVEVVADYFDARRDGQSRIYEYHILNRTTPSPFYLNRAWHLHEPLDVEAMRRGDLVLTRASMIFPPSAPPAATPRIR